MTTKGDAFAFPVPETVEGGLTKREYFAAKAMQGLVADKEFNEKVGPNGEVLARAAVKQADCLIAELNKELP